MIVESLETHEVRTGQLTAEYVSTLETARRAGVAVEFHTCSFAAEFVQFLRELTVDVAATGRTPLLHIECHGDAEHGLEFENGSVLSWAELSDCLVELNKASRFNLVAVLAACYGAHLLSRLSTVDPAPCYALIAPTDSIAGYEILAGFRKFYAALFLEMDAGVAVDAIVCADLDAGQWFGYQAELWYEKVTIGFIESQCTKKAMRARSLKAYRRACAEGKHTSISSVKRELQRLNREGLLGRFFDTYFLIDAIPENRWRFRAVHERMMTRMAVLANSGRYGI